MVACSCVYGICNVRRHNGGVLPGEAGYELKPFSGNKRRVGNPPALILFLAIYAKVLLFFNDMDLQIVKINRVHETVLIKAYFGVPPEFFNGRFQPDRLA